MNLQLFSLTIIMKILMTRKKVRLNMWLRGFKDIKVSWPSSTLLNWELTWA